MGLFVNAQSFLVKWPSSNVILLIPVFKDSSSKAPGRIVIWLKPPLSVIDLAK